MLLMAVAILSRLLMLVARADDAVAMSVCRDGDRGVGAADGADARAVIAPAGRSDEAIRRGGDAERQRQAQSHHGLQVGACGEKYGRRVLYRQSGHALRPPNTICLASACASRIPAACESPCALDAAGRCAKNAAAATFCDANYAAYLYAFAIAMLAASCVGLQGLKRSQVDEGRI